MAAFNGTIEIRENPITSAKTYSHTFERSAGAKGSGYSDVEFSHRADGGYYRARFMIKGSRAEMSEFMQDGLGREVVIVGNDGKRIWEGYVHKMEYDAGRVAYSADLGSLSNSVWLRYRVRGSSTTSRSTAQSDTDSVANYGTKQFILSGGELESSAVADSIALQYLNNHKAPSGAPTRIDPEKELAEFPTISVECRGWFDTLNWVTYNQTTSTDNQGASVQIDDVIGSPVMASGGTTVDNNGYRIHTFLTSGTFTVTEGGTAEVLVVAGGGAGGGDNAGNAAGGGAGGVIYDTNFTLASGSYSVTVGNGGTYASNVQGASGQNSVFGTDTAIGGGGGGFYAVDADGANGGSGGGVAQAAGGTQAPGTGTAGQGNAGGAFQTLQFGGSGGGGAGAAGGITSGANFKEGGAGGIGVANSITGSQVYYGGGGGGATHNTGTGAAAGGLGGGGAGKAFDGTPGVAGTANTGGGGGAGGETFAGGNGGSGIVVIRYPFSAAGIVGQFVKSKRLQTNATLVSKEYDADRRGGDIVSDIARLGDASGNRWLVYMDDDRAFVYEPARPPLDQD